MGATRDRMIAEMELRGMAAATKKSYLLSCRALASHFMKSPEQLRADDVKAMSLTMCESPSARTAARPVSVNRNGIRGLLESSASRAFFALSA